MLTGHPQISRYKHLRKIGLEINHQLVAKLTKDVMNEGGRKLGILKGKTLVLDSVDEIAVLMDFCIHDIRRSGRTAVEDFLAEQPFPPGSDEMLYLDGLRKARFGIFFVEAAESGLGVRVLNVVRGDRLLIVDMSLSRTASPGLALATRIATIENMNMTTGAPLPIGLIPADGQRFWLPQMAEIAAGMGLEHSSPEQRSQATARIIRRLLADGAAEYLAYEDPEGAPRRARPAASRHPSARVGRNDPCPCGSGRRFRKCCGRKR